MIDKESEEEEGVEDEGTEGESEEVQEPVVPELSIPDTLAQKVDVSTPITRVAVTLYIDDATWVLYDEFKRRGYDDDLGKLLCAAFKEWAKTPRKGCPGLEVAIVESGESK